MRLDEGKKKEERKREEIHTRRVRAITQRRLVSKEKARMRKEGRGRVEKSREGRVQNKKTSRRQKSVGGNILAPQHESLDDNCGTRDLVPQLFPFTAWSQSVSFCAATSHALLAGSEISVLRSVVCLVASISFRVLPIPPAQRLVPCFDQRSSGKGHRVVWPFVRSRRGMVTVA